jgi:hypothetical protein
MGITVRREFIEEEKACVSAESTASFMRKIMLQHSQQWHRIHLKFNNGIYCSEEKGHVDCHSPQLM